MELADLFLANLNAVDQEPQSFLDGKLLISKKRRLVEVEDSLTHTEAFTIFQMVICASHPPSLVRSDKIRVADHSNCQSSGRAWLEYDLAFWRDAAATGASD